MLRPKGAGPRGRSRASRPTARPMLPLWPPPGPPPDCHGSATGTPVTVVLAAFLTGAQNVHVGAFGMQSKGRAGVLRELKTFLERSSGVCRSNVHLIHDELELTDSHAHGVQLHRFEPNASLLGNDVRWSLFANVLGWIKWDCAFAVDLTDVSVLCLPACMPGSVLAVASDVCSGGSSVKRWLRRPAGNLRPTLGENARFDRFLEDRSLLANSGVVGGHRSVFGPALGRLVQRLEHHWVQSPRHRLKAGADMVLWNWEALSGIPIITGYPTGPVNLPMWGKLATEPPGAPNNLCAVLHEDPADAGQKCSYGCREQWASMSKAPPSSKALPVPNRAALSLGPGRELPFGAGG